MDIKTEKMPTPVKYIVTVDADDVDQRKKATYEQVIKDDIKVIFKEKHNDQFIKNFTSR